MDITFLTATAATLGSLVGGGASVTTTWITQRTQSIRSQAEWKLREREAMYKQFITEASRLAVEALTHSLERPDQIMTLYGVLSCIRLVSGQEVVREGEACCRRIIEQFGKPNLTTDQLGATLSAKEVDELDPLRDFSKACRDELLQGA
jgi:hypothetical protein